MAGGECVTLYNTHKCWKNEIAMGGWCWSRHKNFRGQELEESRPQQRRMGTVS